MVGDMVDISPCSLTRDEDDSGSHYGRRGGVLTGNSL